MQPPEINDALLPEEIENLEEMQRFLLRAFKESTAWVGKKNVTDSNNHCYASTLAATAATGYAAVTDILSKNRDKGPN
jgi:ribosome biogenesis SPOUT family RNA methylase Rps3